jgi:hypothetical protein
MNKLWMGKDGEHLWSYNVQIVNIIKCHVQEICILCLHYKIMQEPYNVHGIRAFFKIFRTIGM